MPKLYKIMKNLGVLLVLILAGMTLVYAEKKSRDAGKKPPVASLSKPNIIFFLVDDYDKPETSPYGGKVLTPNLDRLAKEGMLFNNAYVTSTVCTPSRYTMLTGRYASSSTYEGFQKLFPPGTQTMPAFNVGLEKDKMNIGNILAQNGYATGFVGKYHVGHEYQGEEAVAVGLHDLPKNIPYTDERNMHKYENEKRYREMIKDVGFTWAKNIYWGNMKAPFKGHNPEWTTAAALEFIEEHRNQPFYLHVCSTLLHGPNGEWYKSLTEKELVTDEGMIKKPLNVMPARKSVMQRIKKAGLTENEAGYLWMDDSLGMILDKLDKLGIADNTIVVFISDHGSEMKGSLFKSRGMEVPCIIRWPNGIKAGTVCNELIQNTDFVPTWFDLAGVTKPKGYQIDGVSIAPLFKNPNKPVRDFVFGEMGAARSIKTKDWNLITLRYPEQILEESRRSIVKLMGLSGGVARAVTHHPTALDVDQLYNISQDGKEQVNLAKNPEHSEQLKAMKRILTNELTRFDNRPYGEFVPGGNTTNAQESIAVLIKLREMRDSEGNKKGKKKRKKKDN